MKEIEFDFCAAGQAMRQTEEAANRVNTEAVQELEEILGEISEAWQGKAASRFQEIAGIEAGKVKQTGRLLEQAGASLQEAILTARRIEEKTKEIAELRTY